MNKYVWLLIVVCCVSFFIGISLRPTSKPVPASVSLKDTLATFAKEQMQMPKLDNTALLNKVEQSEFEVDFKAMNAFSIERSNQDNQAVTIVGYKDKDGSIGQWYLCCSDENHKRLAEQFKKDILGK